MSSVTLAHPAKAVGLNEMPFGRESHVVSSDIVLDRVPSPYTRRGDFGGQNTQFAAMPPVAKIYFGSCYAAVLL